jgi:hypothetical protein
VISSQDTTQSVGEADVAPHITFGQNLTLSHHEEKINE